MAQGRPPRVDRVRSEGGPVRDRDLVAGAGPSESERHRQSQRATRSAEKVKREVVGGWGWLC